jgi:ABC-type multidrug transport system permease subunit
MSVYFRLVACITPSLVMAQIFGAFTLQLLCITSGYAIVRGSIPGWCGLVCSVLCRASC